MSFTAEFIFNHDDIFLRRALSDHESAHIKIAYATQTEETEQTVFFHLIDYSQQDEFEDSLDDDETVKSWSCLYEDENYCSYSTVPDDPFMLYRMAAEMGILVEDMWTEDGKWHVQLMLPTRRLLKQIRELLEEYGVEYSLAAIRPFEQGEAEMNLTDGQFELLQDAFEGGYFQVPRNISQAELAERHGITESAVSQQVRRALHHVLAAFFRENTDQSL